MKLTPRQRDCLVLVALGHRDAAIAWKLDITEETVQEYVDDAKKALGAKTRAHAVALALEHGLLKLQPPVAAN